jgi:hypothetical protein
MSLRAVLAIILVLAPVALAEDGVIVRVTRGGRPLAGATVMLRYPRTTTWKTFATGADGTARIDLRQAGELEVNVRGLDLVTPYIVTTSFDGRAVNIDVPARTISGTVVDVAGTPAANANVALRTTLGDSSKTVRTTTDRAGRFRFTAVDPGRQGIVVIAGGYLQAEPLVFDLTRADVETKVSVILERGFARRVEVRGADGAPLAGALVACVTGEAVRSTATTDPEGRVLLGTPAGKATLFVIPKDGSFAIRRIRADEEVVRVDVPAAAASLELATMTTDRKPVAEIAVLLRYNGELLPPAVAREIEKQQKVRFRTGEDGRVLLAAVPRGVYEIWPYRTEREADSLLAAASAMEAPATVNVVSGENKVTIRLRKR